MLDEFSIHQQTGPIGARRDELELPWRIPWNPVVESPVTRLQHVYIAFELTA
jgi:hypothetical protein